MAGRHQFVWQGLLWVVAVGLLVPSAMGQPGNKPKDKNGEPPAVGRAAEEASR